MLYRVGSHFLFFEIKLSECDPRLAFIRINIKDKCIGDFSEATYIPTFLHRLERCLTNKIEVGYESLHLYDVFEYFMDDETSSEYVLGLGEAFDKYYMFFFHYKNRIYWSWKDSDANEINLEYVEKCDFQSAISNLSKFIVEDVYRR